MLTNRTFAANAFDPKAERFPANEENRPMIHSAEQAFYENATAAAKAAREIAILDVLRRRHLVNEDGEPLDDFQSQGRDRLDFTSVNRETLRVLLEEAFAAGWVEVRGYY